MSKEEVLEKFDVIFKKPEYEYEGNLFHEAILNQAKQLIEKDRNGVIEICRDWLALRREPHTMLAVDLIEGLVLRELREDLENLRKDIESGKAGEEFLPYYNEVWIDKALKAIT